MKGEEIAEGVYDVSMKSAQKTEKSLIICEKDQRICHDRLGHVERNTVQKTLELFKRITLEDAVYIKC